MSGSNNPNRQSGGGGNQQGGRQSPQQGGGQNRRQGGQQPQQQGGQQRGGQQRRQQYGGQPPSGGGGGALGTLGSGRPNDFFKGIVGTMATVGILLGVLVFLLGAIGGFAVLPGAVNDYKDQIEQQQSEGGDQLGTTPQTSVEQINKVQSNTYKTLNGYLVSLVAPFLAFLMAPIFGALVAFQMSGGSKELTVAAGTFVGAILFMILATFISSMSIPDAAAFAPQGTGAMVSAAAESQGISTSLGSVQFVKLLIDSVVVGVVTAAAAAATTFSIDNFVSA